MPRQARLDSPGTLHPVMIRGIEKQRVSQATKWVPAWLAAGGAGKDHGRVENYERRGTSGNFNPGGFEAFDKEFVQVVNNVP